MVGFDAESSRGCSCPTVNNPHLTVSLPLWDACTLPATLCWSVPFQQRRESPKLPPRNSPASGLQTCSPPARPWNNPPDHFSITFYIFLSYASLNLLLSSSSLPLLQSELPCLRCTCGLLPDVSSEHPVEASCTASYEQNSASFPSSSLFFHTSTTH